MTDESPLIRLDLRAPLQYTEAPGLEPFAPAVREKSAAPQEEQLFCFALDPVQSRSIEPDRKYFPGTLVFAGRAGAGGPAGPNMPAAGETGAALLPAGLYLFTQKKKALTREECIDLAIEQQKDGLWERLKPDSRLYVRYLFEDGSPVTQLFRPAG